MALVSGGRRSMQSTLLKTQKKIGSWHEETSFTLLAEELESEMPLPSF